MGESIKQLQHRGTLWIATWAVALGAWTFNACSSEEDPAVRAATLAGTTACDPSACMGEAMAPSCDPDDVGEGSDTPPMVTEEVYCVEGTDANGAPTCGWLDLSCAVAAAEDESGEESAGPREEGTEESSPAAPETSNPSTGAPAGM
ncbi:MAG: hypothetical protein ACPGUV_12450 [Polyangiales bacterium]